MKQPAKYRYGVTWRAVIIGLLLIPLNSYWVFLTEIVRYAGHPTTISLFYNAIFTLFVLILLNKLINKIAPKWTFSQGEMITIYVMINIGSALMGHDFMQVLVPIMAHPFQYASPENQWQSVLFRYIPKWLTVQDKEAVEAFYHGASSIYPWHSLQAWHNLQAWLKPVFWWSSFVVAMLCLMLCTNVLLRKQWTEREKLTYPLVHLPLDMTAENSTFWRNRLLWAGFAVAAAIDIINGLNMLYPSLPAIPIKLEDQSAAFTARPWNGIGWFPVDFYPFGIGLGMLLPLDLLFSCWFFFWVTKAQLIISNYYGWNIIPNFPYLNEQGFGAYMGLAVFAIIMMRKFLWNLVRHFFFLQSEIDDKGEAISYRWAMLGILLCSVFLFVFTYAAGLAWWIIIAFFIMYFALMLAITRIRAELGAPAHDLHYTGPQNVIPTLIGPGSPSMGTQNLTILGMFWWFNRAYRSVPYPFQLEGFKMAERTNSSYKRLFWAMLLAGVVGTFAAFWSSLSQLYHHGAASVGPPSVPLIYGAEAWVSKVDTWLKTPTPPNHQVGMAIGLGFVTTLILNSLRMRLQWFPLHPVGYAISMTWSIHRLWISLCIAWLIKLLLLRYGGLKAYRQALPFFLGIILGECIVGGLWTLIGGMLGVPTYAFWP